MEANKKLSTLLKQKYPKNIYIHIYSILKDSKHSVNDNGIFFNLSDVPQENIQKCIEYIECIDYNVEDHIKNLNIREGIENKYKMDITSSKVLGKRKEVAEKKQATKNEDYSLESLVQKKVYKGVYKRLDRVIRGLKPEEIKASRKKKIEEPVEEEDEDMDDLFGDYDEEELEENLDVIDEELLED
jgi:hypothetical protein